MNTLKNAFFAAFLTLAACGSPQDQPIDSEVSTGVLEPTLKFSVGLIPDDFEIKAFMIRPDLSDTQGNWRILDEGNHSLTGLGVNYTVTTLSDRVVIDWNDDTLNFAQLFTFIVSPDETLVRNGIDAGMSGGISAISIFFKKEGTAGYKDPHTIRYTGCNVGIFALGSFVPEE